MLELSSTKQRNKTVEKSIGTWKQQKDLKMSFCCHSVQLSQKYFRQKLSYLLAEKTLNLMVLSNHLHISILAFVLFSLYQY